MYGSPSVSISLDSPKAWLNVSVPMKNELFSLCVEEAESECVYLTMYL